jgi:hypothetical protein
VKRTLRSCSNGILEYLRGLANHLLLRREHEPIHHGGHTRFFLAGCESAQAPGFLKK